MHNTNITVLPHNVQTMKPSKQMEDWMARTYLYRCLPAFSKTNNTNKL